jgi:hypothetical protein
MGRGLRALPAHEPRYFEDSRTKRSVAQHGDERAGSVSRALLGSGDPLSQSQMDHPVARVLADQRFKLQQ